MDDLTDTQLSILEMMAHGEKTRVIATCLKITPSKVKDCKRNIYRKLGYTYHKHPDVMAVVDYVRWKKEKQNGQQ